MNFLLSFEKPKQGSGCIQSRLSRMPKLKGVEGTKSHKKIRRKRPRSTSSSSVKVKGKGKLGNKGKKVCNGCNFS